MDWRITSAKKRVSLTEREKDMIQDFLDRLDDEEVEGALDDDDDNVDMVVSEIIGDVGDLADTTETDESVIMRKQRFKNMEEVLDPSNFDPLPPPDNNRTHIYIKQK